MADQMPLDIRLHPTDHYDLGLEAARKIDAGSPGEEAYRLSVAHSLLGILRLLQQWAERDMR